MAVGRAVGYVPDVRPGACVRLPRRPAIISILMAVAVAMFGAIAVSVPTPSWASTELLMFEERGCPWCRKWRQEIGPAYPNSPEGKRAPLRVVDIHGAPPAGIALVRPVHATPTFVLVDDNREVGRIVGYPGDAFFWALLGQLIARLPALAPPPKSEVRPIGADDTRSGHMVSGRARVTEIGLQW